MGVALLLLGLVPLYFLGDMILGAGSDPEGELDEGGGEAPRRVALDTVLRPEDGDETPVIGDPVDPDTVLAPNEADETPVIGAPVDPAMVLDPIETPGEGYVPGSGSALQGLLATQTDFNIGVNWLGDHAPSTADHLLGAGDDTLSISARMLTERRAEAVDLLRDSLIAPRFDEDAIERVRAQVLAGLRADQTDPRAIAGREASRLIYGDHPYARPGDGTIDSVSALTREDIVAAHRAALVRDRVHVSAVGDITAEELGALLDRLLGDLPLSGPPLPDAADPALPGGVRVIDFETPQSVALFAQPGPDRHHPDFMTAYVLNHILGGGGFESRLMTEVREKRGLTYGVYSYLADKDAAELWMGSVASGNSRMAEAIAVIRDQWARLRDEGVTAEELENAKTYLTGAYPLRFEGNAQIASIAAGMQLDGLPVEYNANRNAMVEAITLEDVNRVAREWLDPARLTFFVVGQPEGVESTLN